MLIFRLIRLFALHLFALHIFFSLISAFVAGEKLNGKGMVLLNEALTLTVFKGSLLCVL